MTCVCLAKNQYRHSGKVPKVIEVRKPGAISSLTNDMESVNRLRRDNGYRRMMAIRIAKDDSVHAIWLK